MTKTPQKIEALDVGLNFSFDPSAPLPDDLVETQREYDTLDDAQRVKHVYACAGLALYYAQCFEEETQIALLLVNRVQGNIATLGEYDLLEKSLSEKTLGQLLGSLRELVGIDDDGAKLLKMAAKARNTLAHGFFQKYAESFMTDSGKRVMLDDLLRRTQLFRVADRFAHVITKRLLSVLGMPEERIDTYVDEWLAQVRARDDWDGESSPSQEAS